MKMFRIQMHYSFMSYALQRTVAIAALARRRLAAGGIIILIASLS